MTIVQRFSCNVCSFQSDLFGIAPFVPGAETNQRFFRCTSCKTAVCVEARPDAEDVACHKCKTKCLLQLDRCPACESTTAGWY